MNCERCGAKTRGGKPLCQDHVAQMPYLASLVQDAEFKREEERLKLKTRQKAEREAWLEERRQELDRAHESSRLAAFGEGSDQGGVGPEAPAPQPAQAESAPTPEPGTSW